jgi:hypothetical protein
MAKARVGMGLVAGCLLACWGAAPAGAAPTVSQMLGLKPRQEGVNYSTPTAQEESSCKVEQVKWGRSGSGWLLRDAKGRPLRRFYNTRFTDVNDGTKMDVWCYFKDGVEVYREWASKNGAPPDQFRWMNAGGMKWGVDENHDGKIDSWKMISPEEVSQEVLQAIATHDAARFQALLISEAELKALELPAAEITRIQAARAGAAAKFQATLAKLTSLDAKTRWLHLEAAPPQCLPAEQTGMARDLIKYANGTILYEANGKSDWLQTGEMLQVGLTWRLTDAPTAGAPVMVPDDVAPGAAINATDDKEMQTLLDQLKQIDEEGKSLRADGGPNPQVVRYNLRRADVLEKMVLKAKGEERDPWVRQVADSLSAAAQSSPAGDKTAYRRLQTLEGQTVRAMPSSGLAAYVTFREISADYAARLATKDAKFDEVQKWWVETLARFVQKYPKADDAADALGQLGMVNELMGKETEAKNWYQRLAKDFADKPQSAKAQGAVRRLELEGKPLELAGPQLGSGTAFELSRLKGKVVAVYYWASWNGQCAGDFARLKLLLDKYGSKGLELVCVNLDTSVDDATAFLKSTQAPGVQLYKEGGLESPLATQYGIMVLPNLFLVDKDGKVASRTVQVGTLEEELKKLLK